MTTETSHDSAELEALFENVSRQHWAQPETPSVAPPPVAAVPVQTAKQKRPEAKRRKHSKTQQGNDVPDKFFSQIGHMTRTLHDTLQGLGYDKALEKAAAAIPDARDRLAYVANMTAQAAERVLNAVDLAKPEVESLQQRADLLHARWEQLFGGNMSVQEFRQLALDTRGFLAEAPKQAANANTQLMEIMMAQDFQDLTGQVLRKVVELAKELEEQLLHFLIENMPDARRTEVPDTLLNGPVVKADGRADVVTNQAQVDELLASLGF
jgi:chemotaxis protein CheZ